MTTVVGCTRAGAAPHCHRDDIAPVEACGVQPGTAVQGQQPGHDDRSTFQRWPSIKYNCFIRLAAVLYRPGSRGSRYRYDPPRDVAVEVTGPGGGVTMRSRLANSGC